MGVSVGVSVGESVGVTLGATVPTVYQSVIDIGKEETYPRKLGRKWVWV